MTPVNKLIRDGVPDACLKSGRTPHIHVVKDDGEYARLLKTKLMEEIQEFVVQVCAEEAADVIEVLEAILKLHGISLHEVFAEKRKKWDRLGGFDKRLFLERVE